jgi:hypothetical protein
VRVAIITSFSQNISGMVSLTMANHMEYCLRHGYSLIFDYKQLADAYAGVATLVPFLDVYDIIWTLDADAVITNMAQRIDELDCLGPHVTVCEEGIVSWNRLNCGSIVWKNTPESRALLNDITARRSEWESLPCVWQTWLANRAAELGPVLSIAPLRAFNSCVWNKPGGGEGPAGSHWHQGDFVYHACGVFPAEEKLRYVANALLEVER